MVNDDSMGRIVLTDVSEEAAEFGVRRGHCLTHINGESLEDLCISDHLQLTSKLAAMPERPLRLTFIEGQLSPSEDENLPPRLRVRFHI